MSEAIDHLATDSRIVLALRIASTDSVNLERVLALPGHIAEMLNMTDEPEATRAHFDIRFGTVVTRYTLKYYKDGVDGRILNSYRFEADALGVLRDYDLTPLDPLETFIY